MTALDTISQAADRALDGMLCGVAFDASMRGAAEAAMAIACFARHEPIRQWHGRTRRGRGVSRSALRKARERDGMAVRGALHMEAAQAWESVAEQARGAQKEAA